MHKDDCISEGVCSAVNGAVIRISGICDPDNEGAGEDKIIGRDVTVREMIEEVEKDRPYYYRSGGGMTLSGGECLCQPEFTKAF